MSDMDRVQKQIEERDKKLEERRIATECRMQWEFWLLMLFTVIFILAISTPLIVRGCNADQENGTEEIPGGVEED